MGACGGGGLRWDGLWRWVPALEPLRGRRAERGRARSPAAALEPSAWWGPLCRGALPPVRPVPRRQPSVGRVASPLSLVPRAVDNTKKPQPNALLPPLGLLRGFVCVSPEVLCRSPLPCAMAQR